MKISEMNTDQACDAMVRMTNPIANICDDPGLEPLLKELAGHEGEGGVNGLMVISKMLPKIVPLLLVSHRDDLYEITSVLSGTEKAKVGKTKFTEIIRILKDSIDNELIGFFKLSGHQAKTPGN